MLATRTGRTIKCDQSWVNPWPESDSDTRRRYLITGTDCDGDVGFVVCWRVTWITSHSRQHEYDAASAHLENWYEGPRLRPARYEYNAPRQPEPCNTTIHICVRKFQLICLYLYGEYLRGVACSFYCLNSAAIVICIIIISLNSYHNTLSSGVLIHPLPAIRFQRSFSSSLQVSALRIGTAIVPVIKMSQSQSK